MFDTKLFFDPMILTVLVIFFGLLTYFIINVIEINKDLKLLTKFLKTLKKSEIVYRFKELDDTLSNNNFIASYWMEFKNTLVFNENIVLKTKEDQLMFDNVSEKNSNIQCTVDSVYFFNEDTLIHNKLNYKFITVVPTILTGLGPLFTFLNISFAFAKVDFTTQEATLSSISSLMTSMKAAAMVSVVAVAASIIFIIIERLLYLNLCRKPLQGLQLEINKLFDNISSEKFLVDLLKETKIQNHALGNIFNTLPDQIQNAFDQSISNKLIPYMDNLIFTLNKLQEKKTTQTGSVDIISELFDNKEK